MYKPILSTLFISLVSASIAQDSTPTDSSNNLAVAVAWKQTAAEYEALYYQAFNLAKAKVDQALAEKYDKPLAIITDIDDTILLHPVYWSALVKNNKDFFDDPDWDAYIPKNQSVASPGAQDFLQYCADKGVEVFYVSARNQGEKTHEYGKANLTAAGFPFVDDEHVTILTDTSNKAPRQQAIAEKYEVVVYLGDSLNDFSRKYYVKSTEERKQLMAEDKALYGDKFILTPNPTDGHWVRALFGESEPAPSEANRKQWVKAAQQSD